MSGWRDLARRARRDLGERELSDYLSPILVKEARQGVRGSAFTGSFLLLQGLMALSLIAALLGARGVPDQTAAALFWMSVAAPALMVLPLSGLAALSSERELGTLEPMLLTRLTAQRIVAGKWAAIAAQIALLFTAVLPYVLLRYFLGGVDLGRELVYLFQLTLSSTLVTALAVALSAGRMSSLFRMIVVLGLAVPIHGAIQGVMELSSRGGAAPPALGPAAALLLLWALSVQIALDSGAAALAPGAESSSMRVRLLALAAVPVAWYATPGIRGAADSRVLLGFWVGLLLATVLMASLAERRREPALLDAPFFGGGRLRALAGAFLAPGWPSGVLFATLVVALVTAVGRGSGRAETALIGGGAVLATLLQPVALTQRLAPHTSRRGTLYGLLLVGVLLASLCGELLLALVPELPAALPDTIAAISPLVYFIRHVGGSGSIGAGLGASDVAWVLVACASLTLALGPALLALRERRRRLRPGGKHGREAVGEPASA